MYLQKIRKHRFWRKYAKIHEIPDVFQATPELLKNFFKDRRRAVGIAKHTSWHAIRQSGQARIGQDRDSHDSQVPWGPWLVGSGSVQSGGGDGWVGRGWLARGLNNAGITKKMVVAGRCVPALGICNNSEA